MLFRSFRGALDAVDAAEIMAAQSMGMSRWQVFRHIELPQMMRFSVPGMVNEFTNVLKYSPFGYTVGIPEMTKQALALSSATLRGVEIYLASTADDADEWQATLVHIARESRAFVVAPCHFQRASAYPPDFPLAEIGRAHV